MADRTVHRDLHSGDSGVDVKHLQHAEAKLLRHYKLSFLAPKQDGSYGVGTTHATTQSAFVLGLSSGTLKATKKGRASKRVQRLIRNPQLRGPIARARALTRKPTLRHWRKAHAERHPKCPPVISAMLSELGRLIARDDPYVWGGGHVTPANEGPGDCSWLASRLAQIAVPGMATGTTFTLATDSHLADGEGDFFTLHIVNSPASEAHVIEEWSGKCFADGQARWSECGGSDNTRRGGACWFSPDFARIAHFPIRKHIPGL